mmetsp:Transcript_54206/g.106043  ORF Transcript_54206/g.106043 Transcript_54206/m.106043 type:complete len:111 (-) Transcript_54206:588-920(-)
MHRNGEKERGEKKEKETEREIGRAPNRRRLSFTEQLDPFAKDMQRKNKAEREERRENIVAQWSKETQKKPTPKRSSKSANGFFFSILLSFHFLSGAIDSFVGSPSFLFAC